MSASKSIAAETRFAQAKGARYAYRRFGSGSGLPLLCLQHFTGTLDFWDPGDGHDPFTRQVTAFLASNSASAAY